MTTFILVYLKICIRFFIYKCIHDYEFCVTKLDLNPKLTLNTPSTLIICLKIILSTQVIVLHSI